MMYVLVKSSDLEPRFCRVENGKIQNNKTWLQWELVQSGSPILYIQDFDMTPKTTPTGPPTWSAATAMAWAAATRVAAAMSATATTAIPRAAAEADWTKAEALWEKDKKIPGGIFLAPSSVLIWISRIDQKYFEER